jgi:hypothetical protein
MIVNDPPLVAKIRAWELSRVAKPSAAPVVVPAARPIPILYDDDDSSDSDADPVPLDQMIGTDSDEEAPAASAMEKELAVNAETVSAAEEEEERTVLLNAKGQPMEADVQFDSGDYDILP